MGIDTFFITSMTIQRASATTDRYGDDVADWTSPTTTVVSGWLHDLSSFESYGNRDTTSVSAQIFLPSGTDITSGDRVVIGGITYEVEGAPNVARTPLGEHHLEVSLRIFDDARGAV